MDTNIIISAGLFPESNIGKALKHIMQILAFAIEANIDVLITGDKDFDEIKIQKPKTMKARNYIDEYMK
ncbi:MAG: hypothetical protein LBD55_08025 [Treponema sp.]|nr:hypothetical protein [Treponema sp.]